MAYENLVRILAPALVSLSIAGCQMMRGEDEQPPVAPPPDVEVVDESQWKPNADTDLRPIDEADLDENEPPFEEGFEPKPEELTTQTNNNERIPSLGSSTAARTKLRAATFNSHFLGGQKSLEPVPDSVRRSVGGAAGLTKGRYPFQLARDGDVHIMGVQEVVINESRKATDADWQEKDDITGHPLLNGSGDGEFEVRIGDPVFIYIFNFKDNTGTTILRKRTEYCPIIYNKNELECGADSELLIDDPAVNLTTRIEKRRHAHRVDCTLKKKGDQVPDEKKSFAFYCAHFAANRDKNKYNIGRLPTMLASAVNVIIAADFNSNSNIGGQFANEYRAAIGQRHAKSRIYDLPTGGFTKIRRVRLTGEIVVRKDEKWRFLDDVLWSANLDPPNRPKNLRRYVVSFGKKLVKDQAWFRDYETVSDHLPVFKDFEF